MIKIDSNIKDSDIKDSDIKDSNIKKRGRKSKKDLEAQMTLATTATDSTDLTDSTHATHATESTEFVQIQITESEPLNSIPTEPIHKKRGRKPKGGKIVQNSAPFINDKEIRPNIILHLKCSMSDLETNTMNNIENFIFLNSNNLSFDVFQEKQQEHKNVTLNMNDNTNCNNYNTYDNTYDYDNKSKNDIKNIWKKLKILENDLHTNNICDKKSACFWCTYEFDNPPIHIPKHYIKNSFEVYGCFCSPECATAYLMNEHIDSSSKFERYHLLNNIYAKIYDYTKNIKPAPNPYYMLDKYYGNLSIQEYRSLLRNERLFLIVDKPLTRILPELHEDNDDFIINNKIIPSNTCQNKKKNKNSKNSILNNNFGLNQ
jgi:hypothetical protein